MEKLIDYPGLVLERKKGEKIIINGDIIIDVAEIIKSRVRLRIIAPKGVSINREEIQIKKENRDVNTSPKS